MGERANALADTAQKTYDDFASSIQGLPDAQWRGTCASEGWTAAATARHVAQSLPFGLSMARAIADRQPLPPITLDSRDERNAQHAKEHANCSKEEVLGLLRQHAPTVVAAIKGMSDEQLDRSARFEAMGSDLSTQQAIERILIGHSGMHMGSIKAAS